jgi:hypothetical protein
MQLQLTTNKFYSDIKLHEATKLNNFKFIKLTEFDSRQLTGGFFLGMKGADIEIKRSKPDKDEWEVHVSNVNLAQMTELVNLFDKLGIQIIKVDNLLII